MTDRIRLQKTLEGLPPEWPHDPLPAIRAVLAESGEKLAVLDDDPTGTQTVHSVSVLMDWSPATIEQELSSDFSAFFMVTNTRGMTLDQARRTNAEVGRNLLEVESRTGRNFSVVSRGDSTLRGHFPGEVEAIDESLGGGFDAWIFAPFFLEGGRFTIDDVHYVSDGTWLTPAGETEFAQDPAFGYSSSNLREWMEEMTGGDVTAEDVSSISLQEIREGGPEAVTERLLGLSDRQTCIVNAVSMRDMEVFALATMAAEGEGKRFLYRTAASFIRARLGQTARPLLTSEELSTESEGGVLVVVGSYVPRSTSQLNELLAEPDITGVEIDVGALLSDNGANEVRRAAKEIDGLLNIGRNVAAYTSRELVTGDSAEENLDIGQRVSDGLVSILQSITATPKAIISKGGMTTYNISSRALGVSRAVGLGQILPGVPVWRLGSESRFPDRTFVVFPGNVGEADAVVQAFRKLSNP